MSNQFHGDPLTAVADYTIITLHPVLKWAEGSSIAYFEYPSFNKKPQQLRLRSTGDTARIENLLKSAYPHTDIPLSTGKNAPLICLESSQHKNKAAFAISDGSA